MAVHETLLLKMQENTSPTVDDVLLFALANMNKKPCVSILSMLYAA